MITLILSLVWMHCLADFFLQSDAMAKNKSKSNKWLTLHIATYMLPFIVFGWKYMLVNAAIHWCVDWCSSRITSKLWEKKEVHWFFVVIGVDQALHITSLILTIPLIG